MEVNVGVFYLFFCWWGTSHTQGCHVCVGMGRKPCKQCAGSGNVSPFTQSPLHTHSIYITCNIALIFLTPDRKFAGCVMALVSATEVIAATTAMAGAGKSEWRYSRCISWTIHCNDKHNCGSSCSHCHGSGSTECSMCRGKQQLLVYISLTVKW